MPLQETPLWHLGIHILVGASAADNLSTYTVCSDAVHPISVLKCSTVPFMPKTKQLQTAALIFSTGIDNQ